MPCVLVTAGRGDTVLISTVLISTVLISTVLISTVLISTVLISTVLISTVLISTMTAGRGDTVLGCIGLIQMWCSASSYPASRAIRNRL